MTTLRTAAQQVLEALKPFTVYGRAGSRDIEVGAAIAASDTLRAALKQEEEASAWLAERKEHWRKEREKAQATKDQDPELSAALGWPGGISDPVLDRTRLLQMVAAMRSASQQALDWLYDNDILHPTKVSEALRAALAQQAEPVTVDAAYQKWLEGTHAPALRRMDSQGAFAAGWQAALAQQAEPVLVQGELPPRYVARSPVQAEPGEPVAWKQGSLVTFNEDPYPALGGLFVQFWDGEEVAARVYANDLETIRQRCAKINAAPPQRTMVEPVAWMYTGIKQDGTEHGPYLVWKPEYMDAMSASKGAKAMPLYTAPPQRTMVPLTEEEIVALIHPVVMADLSDEMTDYEIARAVEKASWEKNHGQA